MADSKTQWIPLMDYAIRNGVSLSTLRRHIKANKIEFQVQNGRYFLLDSGEAAQAAVATAPAARPTGDTFPIQSTDRYAQLERELRKAREEIAELKTLIAFYEEKIPQRFSS